MQNTGRENGSVPESSVCAGHLSAPTPVLWLLCPANALRKTHYLQCFASAEYFKVVMKPFISACFPPAATMYVPVLSGQQPMRVQ